MARPAEATNKLLRGFFVAPYTYGRQPEWQNIAFAISICKKDMPRSEIQKETFTAMADNIFTKFCVPSIGVSFQLHVFRAETVAKAQPQHGKKAVAKKRKRRALNAMQPHKTTGGKTPDNQYSTTIRNRKNVTDKRHDRLGRAFQAVLQAAVPLRAALC